MVSLDLIVDLKWKFVVVKIYLNDLVFGIFLKRSVVFVGIRDWEVSGMDRNWLDRKYVWIVIEI